MAFINLLISKFTNSLFTKILLVSIPIIIIASLIFWYPPMQFFKNKEVKSYIKLSESNVDMIKKALNFGMLKNNKEYIAHTIDSLATAEDILWIRIMDAKGRINYKSVKNESQPPEMRISKEFLKGISEKSHVQIIGTDSSRVLNIVQPIYNVPSCYTASCHFHTKNEKVLGMIDIGISMQSMYLHLQSQKHIILAFIGIFLFIIITLMYLIIYHFVLNPLTNLTNGIQKVANGDLSHHIDVGTNDEIEALANNFNQMTERLKERKDAVEKELDEYRTSLLQAQKMEAIGTMATGIAHDFNNMLTGIIGYSELAEAKTTEPHVKQQIGKVVDIAAKAAELTRQILLIGRKLPPQRKPLDINQVVEDSLSMFRRMVEENIEIKLSLKSRLPLIFADASQLTQVLMNLILNARDAMPEGGVLKIKTSEFYAYEDYCSNNANAIPGRYVVLYISDTGDGIPEKIKHRIFEPFFTTKQNGKGTGLGLAVTYSIVKNHGGWINIYSEPGMGTEFKIYLPILKEDDKIAADIKEIPFKKELPKGTETILLVDDEQTIREIGSSLLLSLGYKVITASDGLEALDIYKQRASDISIVILDKVMPKMNGIEVFHRLREFDPDVKVIISSGYAADEEESLKEVYITGFLNKPYTTTELAVFVREALDKN